MKGASTVGTTVVIASGNADGTNNAAFASCVVVVESDFCKATRDDERLPFCPMPWVGGLLV